MLPVPGNAFAIRTAVLEHLAAAAPAASVHRGMAGAVFCEHPSSLG
jgi:hypothetical protein